MNALSTVQFAMPKNDMAVLPVIALKWRVANIRAALGQEEFR